jgi:thymidylate kinase
MKDQISARRVNCADRLVYQGLCSSQPSQNRKKFLSSFFKELDTSRIRYCVLHSWDDLPDKLSSDLDIAVHPEDIGQLRFIFRFLRKNGYIPIQLLNYGVRSYYFVFCWFEELVLNFVSVDLIFEHRRGGLVLAPGETLVCGRQKLGIFWIPDPEIEFAYLLAKKSCKGAVSAPQAGRLKFLVTQLGRSTANNLAGQLFLGNLRERVVEACASGHLDALLARNRGQTWKTALVRNPLRLIRYLFADGVRLVRRWLQPTGLFVVIMGPDGVGKSTLIEHLLQAVAPAFRRHRVFHWRPMLLWRRKAARDTTQPHSHPPNAGWWSIARLFAHLLDYWLGYWMIIRPLLTRSSLVVFDRYFQDLLADPKRYRYGGPSWLVRSVSWLVPKPDFLFILDAPVQVILSRKQEVMPQEVHSQRQVYLELASSFCRSRVIDSTAPLARVVEEAGGAVCEYLAQRFIHRNADWLDLSPSGHSK